MSSYKTFEDLDLTRDEVERIGAALKDKEFRKLFVDYVEELQDPENKKLFEKEITQLERERGVDVTFINPVAGYVIKTSVNGNKKGFINICSNENIQKPQSKPACVDGSRGLQWSLPHSLSPPREDVDNKMIRCLVYDVVFHPDTLHLAKNNEAFRNMVNTTACDAVEANFDVKLDKKNLKFPKLQYKGNLHATIIRKPLSGENVVEKSSEEQAIMDKIYASIPQQESPKKSKKPTKSDELSSKYTTPKYVIKHRSHVQLEEFTNCKTAKLNTAIPKELVIEINLPLLKSAGDIELDVTEKSVELTSEKPAKYKLTITLPYHVYKDNGNAKFDKDTKKLTITLPVKRNTKFILTDTSRDDSGVESDHGSPPPVPSEPVKVGITQAFLDDNIHYTFPEYTTYLNENNITLTLNVRNVNENAIEKLITSNTLQMKFVSVSSGFFPVYYAVYLKFPEHSIDVDKLSIEAWDNNVVLQICLNPCDKSLQTFYIGLDENEATEKTPTVQDESKTVQTKTKDEVQSNSEPQLKEVQKANVVLDTVPLKEEPSKAIDILSTCSESSGDEMSCSYSPSSCKGILKRMSSSRSSVSRSISESSIDDLTWASSFENYYNSMDSIIPEDGEISTSLKKTVRFSDNVTRQLFRSNSSILGQKKKNQRKAKNKKRAQERRHSESELSETDDKRERDTKTTFHKEQQKLEDGHIFDFDM